MFDIVAIGGSTKDIFIRMNTAEIIDIKKFADRKSFICLNYGEKIEIDKLNYDLGGGAVNTSVNFSNLGLKTAAIIKVGNDCNGVEILQRLNEKQVDTSFVIKTSEYNTGSSFVITSFEGERTVMMERGANSHISKEEIDWNNLKNTKAIYLSSLSGYSNSVLEPIADFAYKNNIKLAINPGKTQITTGAEKFKKILAGIDILVLNKTEAILLAGINQKYTECNENEENIDLCFNFSTPEISNLDEIFIKLKALGPKVIVITEGDKGSQSYDGKTFYYAPVFPLKAISTLGAGDAFSSTFVACLIKYNSNISKALTYASINAAFVVQDVSAHLEVRTFSKLKEISEINPNYKIHERINSENGSVAKIAKGI